MKNKNIVVLCEDKQQKTFVRRFLKKFGCKRLRFVPFPEKQGAGEQFVRKEYVREVEASRKHGNILLVMIDADKDAAVRRRQLESECKLEKNDRVAVFMPARNIETWLAFLGGDGEKVDETKQYPRLPRERECRTHVEKLFRFCEKGELPANAPPSLAVACNEWRRLCAAA